MDKMKNSGMSETMQTLTRKSACVMLSLLLLLSAVLPVKAAAETASAKVVRVGSFEDTFNYVNEKGARKGYGYELLETLSGYTGWQFEYVTCDWSDCFEKLKNGEIDIIGGISYTEDRTQEMLFSDEPMGVEKYYLYADLSRADISASDFKTLNGKKIGVLMGTEPEVMLAEWEEKYGLKTEHVNISNNEDVKQKLANHEIDCFVSLEESFWAERGISTITRVGESGIYYAINKNRPDIKEELDDAMRALDEAVPFYTADLYKRYFSMDYTPILTGEEKAWLRKHGAIRMGFLASDSGVSTFDPATGEFTGVITDYIQFAADCLGNQELEFQLVGYDSKEAELDALKSGEIDMIFHCDQNPNLAEEYHFACTNTTWTSNLMAVTNKQHFNENNVNRIAVPQNKLSLKKYLAFYYPQWEIVDCDTQEDAARLVKDGQADCFVTGISSENKYSKKYSFYSVPLLNPVKSCFAVNSGNRSLLSILNKTIKAMPVNMLAGALAMYKSSARKVTLSDFIKDNFFKVMLISSIAVAVVLLTILMLLQKARKAEAAARKAASDTQELNAKLQVAVEKAESANRAKTMAYYEKLRVRELLSPNPTMANELVFSPLENWNNNDVWVFLMQYKNPWGYDNNDLLTMYRGATEDGECPMMVEAGLPSCGKSRFGCWVCTMVEQDKSMEAMIANDSEKEWMTPLLEFRNEIGNEYYENGSKDRDRERRDFRRMGGYLQGCSGRLNHGPYVRSQREAWLKRLLQIQLDINRDGPEEFADLELITIEELKEIRRIWVKEKHEFADTLPGIYEEVMGKPFPDDSLYITSSFRKPEWDILKQVCADNTVPMQNDETVQPIVYNEEAPEHDSMLFQMMYSLIDIEANSDTMNNRKGILDQIESTIKQHFYADEADAKKYYYDRIDRRRDNGGKFDERVYGKNDDVLPEAEEFDGDDE